MTEEKEKQEFNKLKQKTREIIINSAILNGIALPASTIISPDYPLTAYALILTFYCIFLAIKNHYFSE